MLVSVHFTTLAVRISKILLAVAGIGAAACGGEISIHGGEDSPESAPANFSPFVPSSAPSAAVEPPPVPTSRAARLTHQQWENSVRDLFRLGPDTAFAKMLRSDPTQNGFLFDNNSTALSVDDALWGGYERAAEQVAEFVTADTTRAAKWMGAQPAGGGSAVGMTPGAPAAGDARSRGRALIESFGLRALRRPLSSAEVDDYLTLFDMGPAMYPGLESFRAGARMVAEAMLQSPFFVYRIEESTTEQAGKIPLTSYEIASRLSFALWNTMPDDALFDSAKTGRLSDPLEAAAQAQRMLADPRARAVVEHFHDQLFEVERFASIKPSPGVFPGLPTNFGADLATENRRFLRELVFTNQGSYQALLTSTETFVNADLAKIYGLPNASSFGSDFRKVMLDPKQRRGILTQLGFLALNATSVQPDPIHRGVFIARRFTCATIAAPPANVPPLPEVQGRTNRETVEAHTQKPGTNCATCHTTLINPLGFPFESYDAIGRFRTMDNNHPVVTSSDALIGERSVHVADALQLADALAASEEAHQCYAKHWLEFTFGRPRMEDDDGLVAKLAGLSREQQQPIVRLIGALVTSQAFLTRSMKEMP